MKRDRNGEIWDFEHEIMTAGCAFIHTNRMCNVSKMNRDDHKVILGTDGATTATVSVCMPFIPFTQPLPEPLPILARTVAGCSNHNSVGETAARDTLEQVMADALLKSASTRSSVQAVCLSVSSVNHPTDQHRILNWLWFAPQKIRAINTQLHSSLVLPLAPIEDPMQICVANKEIFPNHVRLFVQNAAVVALASGTMGKLHGCVAGTGTIAYGFTEDRREARVTGEGNGFKMLVYSIFLRGSADSLQSSSPSHSSRCDVPKLEKRALQSS